ncbi:MAG: AbrB/MazE/SpoVT family DNA-binding domain-containing protein [Candidatus Hydrothermarchaeales archaeon]
MGIKLKVDGRGRVTIPIEVRGALGIEPNKDIVAEEREEGLLIYKKISPDEFLREATKLQEEIRTTKVTKEDALKAKDIWKTMP